MAERTTVVYLQSPLEEGDMILCLPQKIHKHEIAHIRALFKLQMKAVERRAVDDDSPTPQKGDAQ